MAVAVHAGAHVGAFISPVRSVAAKRFVTAVEALPPKAGWEPRFRCLRIADV
jgi:hypothetical protein